MALTQLKTGAIADDAVTTDKLANAINTERTANTAKDLTALSASNLTSGTVPDARFPATLPAVSGANLTGIGGGITEVDHYRVDANLGSANDNTVISNWERMGTSIHAALGAPHGTGMSISSGVFTFPSTGKYLVFVNFKAKINQNDTVRINTQLTTNNSTYTSVTSAVEGVTNAGGNNSVASGSSFCFVDVTDVSQVKVQFHIGSQNGGQIYGGSTDATDVLFIRIGDT